MIFNFVNLSEYIRLFHDGLTPVARSRLLPNWVRLHEDQVFYYRSPEHGFRYVLSIAFKFSQHDNEHQFALLYPYSYSTLTNYLNRLVLESKRRKRLTHYQEIRSDYRRSKTPDVPISVVRQSPDLAHLSQLRSPSSMSLKTSTSDHGARSSDEIGISIRLDIIASSILSKSIYRMQLIGPTQVDLDKPTVVVTCRWAGNLDAPTSLVCQAMIDYMTSESMIATLASRTMNLVAFPMIDPDSSWTGNSHSDILGQLHHSIHLRRNDVIYSYVHRVRNEIEEICNRSKRTVILDLKTNMNLIGSRVIGTNYEDTLRMERHLSFPRLLAQFSSDFFPENCKFTPVELKSGNLQNLDTTRNIDRYQLEISPFASYKMSLSERSFEEFDQLRYLKFGKSLVYTLLDLLKPKDPRLDSKVNDVLAKFHLSSNDIDHLVLRERECDI